jgi:pilus assembly protein CpaE
MKGNLRILVALADPADRTMVREVVREAEGFDILAYAATGTEAVQMNASNRADVVLLAADLPRLDGYQAARMISLHAPATRILLVDATSDVGSLQRAMGAGARGLIRQPIDAEQLLQSLRHFEEQEEQRHDAEFLQAVDPARAPVTVAVCGSKGGIGKTTMAINLAVSLAKLEAGGVALADLSVQFGDVSSMLDARPKRTLADVALAGDEMDAELLRQTAVTHETGLAIFIGSLAPQPIDVFTPQFVDNLLIALRQAYRFVVLDLPPILHAGTLAALSRADHVLVVCGASDVTMVASTCGYIDVLLEGYVSPERLHIILNRTARTMPLQLSEVEEAVGRRVSMQVPADERRMVAATNDGTPAVLSQASSPAAGAIAMLASRIHKREPLVPTAAQPAKGIKPDKAPKPEKKSLLGRRAATKATAPL